MQDTLIKNAQIVNEGKVFAADVLIKNGRIEKIAQTINAEGNYNLIDAKGKHLLPGVIDDQVHFREPGMTHKAQIASEARAAVAGGVTSFMEMPNTVPNALTQELLEDKYRIASQDSIANYSFFMGASNDNIEQVLRTDSRNVCGIKIFMGSSTGNMLVDAEKTLEGLFGKVDMLIATHCEDEATIRANMAAAQERFGDNIPMDWHPIIRNEEACYRSSAMAVDLAKKHGTRLHILHISTEEELALFRNDIPLIEKKITAEVCVHHLWFDSSDYERLGSQIKCNPAIKEARHKKALMAALLDDRLDIIATDHAPHTWEEKQHPYMSAPSGVPLVQHTLLAMLEFCNEGKISLEKVVEKMCHAPADCFQIAERGYLREGYHADMVLVDLNKSTEVTKENIYYKCGWSPYEGHSFPAEISHTFVSGHLAYENGKFQDFKAGQRLLFKRGE